ncbi:MAG: ImmA/IrrE family metallo-endopeptidase [Candidatus Omnitrophota bacterium]|jgi:Zn-dependent peptidase ImmA (M78 family)
MEFDPTSKTSDQINSDAESFLTTYHPSLTIPIPIENIIESAFNIDIIPIPGLKDVAQTVELNIDAFIGADFKTISIDKYIYDRIETRYRFSLAHEIGHMFLHGYLYNQLRFNNTDEWLALLNEMPKYQRDIVECQANEFAGMVLVPRKILAKELENTIKENEARFKSSFIHKEKLPRSTVIDLAVYPLSLKFNVSENVVSIRLDRDGLLH